MTHTYRFKVICEEYAGHVKITDATYEAAVEAVKTFLAPSTGRPHLCDLISVDGKKVREVVAL